MVPLLFMVQHAVFFSKSRSAGSGNNEKDTDYIYQI